MSVELKIKSKHLSLEASVIRFEERKLKSQIKWLKARQQPLTGLDSTLNSLTNHRRWDVGNENRATFLARAYIAGRPYLTVENKVKDRVVLMCYIVPRMVSMLKKYHKFKITSDEVKNWINAGVA